MLSRRVISLLASNKPLFSTTTTSTVFSYHTARSLFNGSSSSPSSSTTTTTTTTENITILLKEQKEKVKLRELEKKLQKEHALKLKTQKQKSKERLELVKQKEADKLKQQSMKKKKDPNAPKRASTPMLWFTTRNFVIIQNELVANGTIKPETQGKFVIVQSEIKKRWESLSDADRQLYVDLAAQDKLRYQREMALFNKKKEANKRPATSYLRFFQEVRESLKSEFPTHKLADLAKVAGKRWRELSADQKKPYELAFAREMEEYRERHEE
jgi:hypothetical protein